MAETPRAGIDYIRDVAERSRALLDTLQGENEQQQKVIRELRQRLESSLDQLDSVDDVRHERDELRLAVSAQREEIQMLHGELGDLRDKLERHRSERAELRKLIDDMDARRATIAQHHATVETQYSNLLSLYVASCQLQESATRDEVFTIVQEVIINLIGCEELAIYEIEPGDDKLRVARSFGLATPRTRPVGVGEGTIGRVAATGEPFILMRDATGPELDVERGLSACVPLRHRGKVLGLVATYEMLPHRGPDITDIDRELFELLSSHAGAALFNTSIPLASTENARAHA